MIEETKYIEGFNEEYGVTNTGKIISFKKEDRIERKQRLTNKGYCYVNCRINGVVKQISVHRAVALAFIPNPSNLPTVNHKDGDKKNNHVDNLEWSSYVHNNLHALQSGLRVMPKGKRGPYKRKKTGSLQGGFNAATPSPKKSAVTVIF